MFLLAGRGSLALVTISEHVDINAGLTEGSKGEDSADEVFVVLSQGASADEGTLASVEVSQADSEGNFEGVETSMLISKEPSLVLVGDSYVGSDVVVLDKGGMVEVEMEVLARKGDENVMRLNETGLIMSKMDIALDLCEAQPLQSMEFLKSAVLVKSLRSGEEDARLLET